MRKKRSLLKKIFLWFGAILVSLLLIIIGIGVWLSPGGLNFDSPYHPFKTKQAKDKYLTLYDERAKKWPVISTTEMVNTSYGHTFVRISGPKSATALVLMHGAGGNSLQWRPNIESLSKHYRVYAVDNVYDKGKQMVNPSVLTDEELQSIKIPTLFMVGENEKIYSPHEVLERLNRVAPQIKTKLIVDAGHDLTMVQKETVNNLIIEFINQSQDIQ